MESLRRNLPNRDPKILLTQSTDIYGARFCKPKPLILA